MKMTPLGLLVLMLIRDNPNDLYTMAILNRLRSKGINLSYPRLHSMLMQFIYEGFLSSTKRDATLARGFRKKRFYAITKRGMKLTEALQ